MDRTFFFVETIHALLFAHHVSKVTGVWNVRLDETCKEPAVHLTADSMGIHKVLEWYHKLTTIERQKYKIKEVKQIKMFPMENKKTGETVFVRLKYSCVKVTIKHPVGGETMITHTLKQNKNHFTIKSPYGVVHDMCHPDNFIAWGTERWGKRMAQEILSSIQTGC